MIRLIELVESSLFDRLFRGKPQYTERTIAIRADQILEVSRHNTMLGVCVIETPNESIWVSIKFQDLLKNIEAKASE